MEPSSTKVHSVETILTFWTWWWSVCPSSPLEYSEWIILLLKSMPNASILFILCNFNTFHSLAFQSRVLRAYITCFRFHELYVCVTAHSNSSQPCSDICMGKSKNTINQSVKWISGGNVFLCKFQHSSHFSILLSNNFTLHYLPILSLNPLSMWCLLKCPLLLVANNSLELLWYFLCLICYATLSVSNA